MVSPPLTELEWHPSYGIVRSIYPPIWLFEDIAEPADWELIASAEQKTNPRVREEIGDLSLVPPPRRVSGYSASYAMAPFTHVSRDRPSRFSDGGYGVWYSGDRFEVALMETAHHFARFMAATHEPAGEAQFRELVATGIAGSLHDLRTGFDECLSPEDWGVAQRLGAELQGGGSNGVIYPSVRWPSGQAVALFWPDLIKLPIDQGRHLLYHWDGSQVTSYFEYGRDQWFDFPRSAE